MTLVARAGVIRMRTSTRAPRRTVAEVTVLLADRLALTTLRTVMGRAGDRTTWG
jgi:hypothetical protein